jgi:hypothetical protein
MSTYKLQCKATTNPDFGGFRFFVEAGRGFDLDDYTEAYALSRGDFLNPNASADMLRERLQHERCSA